MEENIYVALILCLLVGGSPKFYKFPITFVSVKALHEEEVGREDQPR